MSTTTLKVIALIAMVIDHIYHFIPNTPEWFGWIGRITVPIFIYTLVMGFQYTSNRKKYLTRLYLFSFGMSLMNMLVNYIFRNYAVEDLSNNFFVPLFLTAFILSILEKKQPKYLVFFGVWQIISLFLCVFLADIIQFPNFQSTGANGLIWGAILGNIFLAEGGPLFIIMGVSIYLVRNNKAHIVMVYTFFSLCCFYVSYKWGHLMNIWNKLLFPFTDYQWMMLAAVPFILLYNNKKGAGLKYFFYLFYPIHIVILYLIGFYLNGGFSALLIK